MKVRRIEHGHVEGNCDRCDTLVEWFGYGSEMECFACGAFYNVFGQRLRDDLHSRPNASAWNDDIDDMTGDELSLLATEGDEA